jgi:hypothetical protein
MQARLYKETTDWSPHAQVNHTYLLSDRKEFMLGYISQGTNQPKLFTKPIRFDSRGRTFTLVK